MTTATLTSKGQLTLPKVLRDELNLKPGDKVDFVRHDDGSFHIRPVNTYKGPPVSIKEMDEGIDQAMREKFPPLKKSSRK
jgi:antitoxin PrlF